MQKINFTPSGNKVVILPDPIETVTQNGIIIPDTARRRGLKGTVMAIGDGSKDFPTTVKAGDVVYYGPNYVEFKIDEVEYLIMEEHEILGVC